jgi:hypothetical protein
MLGQQHQESNPAMDLGITAIKTGDITWLVMFSIFASELLLIMNHCTWMIHI